MVLLDGFLGILIGSITNDFLVSLFILKLSLSFSDLLMVLLDGFLGILIGSIGMLQGSIKLKNISLKLLLHAQSFSLSFSFSLEGNLHTINGLLEVLASSKELFLFLSDAALNLLSYLSEFKLGSENLVFFLLKSSFSLFKSSLKFHFLCLKSLPEGALEQEENKVLL